MFYPVDSLRRGGRFYLCWVADSWPLRFAAITHKQLWSNDIRTLCEDLLVVMTNESGRPTERFSLRLSSQLMRGLVRLYERKVTVLMSDLCMTHAHVFKTTNKKFTIHEVHARPMRPLPRLPADREEPGQRVQQLLQNSGNVVSNIQDITLKEATIPEFKLPSNDGFGEEHGDQALQNLLSDRSVELMLAARPPALSQGPAAADQSRDRSLDQSRAPLDHLHMETISSLDATLFRKSTVDDVLPSFDKDIPEIPEIPLPELPVPKEPVPEIQETEPQIDKAPVEAAQAAQSRTQEEAVDEELEELEAQPLLKKRRMKDKLIIDKKTKLDSQFLRARVGNPNVEMRFEDFSDAIIDTRLPADMLFRRPAQGGAKVSAMSVQLARLFMRNLGVIPSADRHRQAQDSETEQVRQRPTRSHLERMIEVQEPQAQIEPQITEPANLDMTRSILEHENIQKDPLDSTVLNVTKDLNVTVDVPNVLEQQDLNQMQVDISDLPTQKLITVSQDARKRASEIETIKSPSKKRRSGQMSFRESDKRPAVYSYIDKENISPNSQIEAQLKNVSTMLQAAGLADMELAAVETQQVESQMKQVEGQFKQVESQVIVPREGSEKSETPLGSLDRTKVSLGDSVATTESQRFIRNHWGLEGTMRNIMVALRHGAPITVHSLLASGPVLPGHARVIAARCFTSLLKLKHHGFIKIAKDPVTLEITDVSLGRRFEQ